MRFFKLLLGSFLWFAGITSCLAQLSKPGMELSRIVGKSEFHYRIDSSGEGVLCKFIWKDSIANMVHLDQNSPQTSIRFNNQGEQAVCELSLKFPDANSDITQLIANIQTESSDSSNNFEEIVAAWLSKSDGIYSDSIAYQLTPVVSIVVKPLGNAKNIASVTIYSGSLLAFTATLTQITPVLTIDSAIIIGDVKIDGGMQLMLQIPTKLQSGSVRLNAVFSSSIIPPTRFNAFVATWGL